MPIIIDDAKAVEQSTFAFTVAFENSAGDALSLTDITWTLTRLDGTVVNSREDVVASSGTSVTITLSGDDLTVFTSDRLTRIVTISGTYTTDGGSTPYLDEVYFSIIPIRLLHREM